jgi:signal transduction histidine kinase
LAGALASASQAGIPPEAIVITNLHQLRQLGLHDAGGLLVVRLEGLICWANPAERRFALLDGGGGAVLELEWQDGRVQTGQRVRITGSGAITESSSGFNIKLGLVVENGGIHAMNEKSGVAFLKAGRNPLRVGWFDREWGFGLKAEWEGPGLPRQSVVKSVLFRHKDVGGWTNGLDFKCYEGWWNWIPDFSELKAVKTGVCTSFDLNMRTRDNGVGMQFDGFIEAPREGYYTFYLMSDDGSRLFVKPKLEVIGTAALPPPRRIFVGQLLNADDDGFWAEVEGRVTQVKAAGEGAHVELSVGNARLNVEAAEGLERAPAALMNRLVRIVGFCRAAYHADGSKVPHVLLVSNGRQIAVLDAPPDIAARQTNAPTLPVLTTVEAVHGLSRAEAQRGYPAIVRGVVTGKPVFGGVVIQDAMRGMFVWTTNSVQLGEYVQVEGVTDQGHFAPMLRAHRIDRLGMGQQPEPVHPTWDQLLNGSLDAQFVEVAGVVVTLRESHASLLTPAGVIQVILTDDPRITGELRGYMNAMVHIRGVLLASWNQQTRQVRVGEIRMCDATVTMEQPTMADIFSVPRRTPSELLLFDPQASLFQRVCVSGQIVHLGQGEAYLMTGSNGLRLVARKLEGVQVGDQVEVAGLPELGGASPVLRDAVVRKTGHVPLPEVKRLASADMLNAEHDSTLVRVEGLLVGMRGPPGKTILDLQAAGQNFIARLNGADEALRALPTGCRLALTGVYTARRSNPASDVGGAFFELLLDSPTDVNVLARPPWWTLQRLALMVGALVFVLAAAMLWIKQLHRQVEQRTLQLEEQVQKRQLVEQHRAMEQERARIAQDLHDELGSGLTEISMLASIPIVQRDASPQIEQVGERAREMVAALDEIVWATNPKHDSLASVGSYFCLYADRFLRPANITLGLNGTLDLHDRTLNSVHRHELFLAFKEALTNVVRHSGATEVRLGLRIVGEYLRVSLVDNGGGLKTSRLNEGMDGLANMRTRLEQIGGRFAIASRPGRGTILRFYLPLN